MASPPRPRPALPPRAKATPTSYGGCALAITNATRAPEQILRLRAAATEAAGASARVSGERPSAGTTLLNWPKVFLCAKAMTTPAAASERGHRPSVPPALGQGQPDKWHCRTAAVANLSPSPVSTEQPCWRCWLALCAATRRWVDCKHCPLCRVGVSTRTTKLAAARPLFALRTLADANDSHHHTAVRGCCAGASCRCALFQVSPPCVAGPRCCVGELGRSAVEHARFQFSAAVLPSRFAARAFRLATLRSSRAAALTRPVAALARHPALRSSKPRRRAAGRPRCAGDFCRRGGTRGLAGRRAPTPRCHKLCLGLCVLLCAHSAAPAFQTRNKREHPHATSYQPSPPPPSRTRPCCRSAACLNGWPPPFLTRALMPPRRGRLTWCGVLGAAQHRGRVGVARASSQDDESSRVGLAARLRLTRFVSDQDCGGRRGKSGLWSAQQVGKADGVCITPAEGCGAAYLARALTLPQRRLFESARVTRRVILGVRAYAVVASPS
jgi:hypothetical protein